MAIPQSRHPAVADERLADPAIAERGSAGLGRKLQGRPRPEADLRRSLPATWPAHDRGRVMFVLDTDTLTHLLLGQKRVTARRAPWQFLRKTTYPRLSMLERFAKAMGMDVKDLIQKTPLMNRQQR